MIMEIEDDPHIPIILGRSFLAIIGYIINVKQGQLTFEVGDEKIRFVLAKSMKNPSFKGSCFSINIVDQDFK